MKGLLDGTTSGGGSKSCRCGTVFRISTAGDEKVLHSFKGPPDGYSPVANLIDVDGTLYGTSKWGGAGSGIYGGTVFSITTKGREHVLTSFGSDGSWLAAGLTNVNGTLYGTTIKGGSSPKCSHTGTDCGVLFSVTTTGVENVPYRFDDARDGLEPQMQLLNVNGTLYGTTYYGGSGCGRGGDGLKTLHCGTVFAFTP